MENNSKRNTDLSDFENKNNKYAIIPLRYKKILEEILCAGNNWKFNLKEDNKKIEKTRLLIKPKKRCLKYE